MVKSANIILIFIVFLFACENTQNSRKGFQIFGFEGRTMGTTYSVKYVYDSAIIIPDSIDNLLMHYNLAVSTYIKESLISRLNSMVDSVVFPLDPLSEIFHDNFKISKEVHEKSGGLYDPTVMPLVNYYGFGYQGKDAPEHLDTIKINSIRQFVGMDKISIYITDTTLVAKKLFQEAQIDFSSVAKGDGVDKIGEYLENQGIKNYLVEIGGECRARGNKPDGKIWTLGISIPMEGANPADFIHYIKLENLSIATSGNYRNYRENKSGKFGHTINPVTGLPEINTIVSATVLSPDCATADAWATAIMTMGRKKTDSLMRGFELELLYIYTDESGNLQTVYSEGFEEYLINK